MTNLARFSGLVHGAPRDAGGYFSPRKAASAHPACASRSQMPVHHQLRGTSVHVGRMSRLGWIPVTVSTELWAPTPTGLVAVELRRGRRSLGRRHLSLTRQQRFYTAVARRLTATVSRTVPRCRSGTDGLLQPGRRHPDRRANVLCACEGERTRRLLYLPDQRLPRARNGDQSASRLPEDPRQRWNAFTLLALGQPVQSYK